MGGDAKSVQHTVVHPMYVSYSSIPTSTANTTLKSKAPLTKQFVNVTTNPTATMNSKATSTNDYPVFFNNITKKIAQSTQTLSNSNNSDDTGETDPLKQGDCECKCHLKACGSPSPHARLHRLRKFPNNNCIDRNTYTKSDELMRGNLEIVRECDAGPPNHHRENVHTKVVFQPHNYPAFGNGSYRCVVADRKSVPVHARPINLSPRRAPFARRDLNLTSYSQEIRDLPNDYLLRSHAVKRTQSHDRIINQQKLAAHRSRARPKSYCSNGHFATPI